MNCLTGFYKPDRGAIYFREKNITHLKPDRIARLGVSRMFQHIEVIRELSVTDNILLGRHIHLSYNLIDGFLFYGRAKKAEQEQRDLVDEIVAFLNLEKVRFQLAGALSYGTQKRVELARAIAMRPEVLILDEPTSGMNQQEKEEIMEGIVKVQETLVPTIVLIEHDMRVVMRISHLISVMNLGCLIAEGSPAEIQMNEMVAEAYLGRD
jgi:branched-chain amino acid transport system ATP-binding protein